MSLASALETLATYRASNTRASQDVLEKGSLILKSGAASNLGDDSWAFLEQLALAALDVGQIDIADQCLQKLTEKFPGSPRVEILRGIRMEATEAPQTVLHYYNELLDANSANAAAWKRRISVTRRMGRVEKTIDDLSQFLDTFYTDLEGWLELADIYSSCNQYTSALQALSHALLLAPQNPFTALQFAETAYSAGDLPLALKTFLIVVDMGEKDLPSVQDLPPTGLSVRAWYGVKLCARQIIAHPSTTSSASNTAVPKSIRQIDEVATERLLVHYSGRGNDRSEKRVLQSWLAG
ncbi:tetratricopeptide repeat domain 35 [Pluteus cervinus]|uniref:Tetratricopeptide repeat domain 35 n=1 Tax=Pluteus cervinus TaxID=181527 RepID=A0ACD3BCQ0_9AGAR|nr:tetratricopeptide repeat domain 35 [Pluteus cervinus]